MSRHNRRQFLKHTAIAASALAAPMVVSSRVFAANDAIHIGIAGIHGRGGAHLSEYVKMKGVRISHLIDPDSRLFAMRSKNVKDAAGNTPKCYQDIRKALEDKDLDAVSIASCNHWHSLLAIWSMQAGKDVYVEKPCSHNVFEGRKCVEAARKYKRIVSHGTQSRGDKAFATAAALIKSGKYGKLLVSKAYASKSGAGRWSIGFKEAKQPPKGFDFNLWLGPAPQQPYHENIVHYNWHWFWDFGNGEIGNQGVHQMDIARWVIPGGTLPKSVMSLGGRWVEGKNYQDQGQTPNFQLAVMDFGGPLLVFEVLGVTEKKGPTGKSWPGHVGNEFYLEEGLIRDGRFYPNGKGKGEKLPAVKLEKPTGNIFANFIDCVRSRKQENLMADIETAHYSAALCHLANASYRLGKATPFGQGYEAAGDCPQVRESIKAIESNLETVLGIDLAKQTYQLGPKLEFDAGTEKFIASEAANQLITRKYREPFVVPEEV
ncbi:MAG: Gfo/Idh/MocA family oxidoreductase [Thermoguttaceae bacterium]